MGTFCSRNTCHRACGKAASVNLPGRNLAANGFRLLTLIPEAEAESEAAVQREWEARTTQWEEMGRRGQLTHEQEACIASVLRFFYCAEHGITE